MNDFQALLLFAFGIMVVWGFIYVKLETHETNKRKKK